MLKEPKPLFSSEEEIEAALDKLQAECARAGYCIDREQWRKTMRESWKATLHVR